MRRAMHDLAAVVAEARVPAAALRAAARLTLDAVACMAGGARTAIGTAARAVATASGTPRARAGRRDRMGRLPVPGGASVVASPVSTPCVAAAAANARMGAALDADDTFMMLHFGVPAVAAALAVTEMRRGTGRDLLDAVAVGFEAGARVLRAFGPLVRLRHGRIAGYARPLWAPVPLVFAAAGAASRALNLGREAAAEAFAIAAANTPVPVAHTGAEDTWGRPLGAYKYVDAGQCAAVGVDAALLAAAGLTGIAGLFDGRDGFWQVCGCPAPDGAALTRGLGERWQIPETSYKPWPSCRWLHYPLTALAALLAAEPIAADEVEEVVVQAPAVGVAPQHVARVPAGWVAAQFSHPHSVAMVLLGVPPGVEWYTAVTLARPDVRELRRRVRVEPHPSSGRLDRLVEDGQFIRLPSAVEVRTRGGRRRAAVERAKGDPWDASTRLSDGELADKLATLAVWPPGAGPRRGGRRAAASDARHLGRALLCLTEAPRLDGIAAALRTLEGRDVTGPVVIDAAGVAATPDTRTAAP
jgi:2-methylcitrate dehydratase PrpD